MILGLQFYRNVTRDLTEITYLRLNIGIMKTNDPIKMLILLIDITIESLQIAHEHIRCLVTVIRGCKLKSWAATFQMIILHYPDSKMASDGLNPK